MNKTNFSTQNLNRHPESLSQVFVYEKIKLNSASPTRHVLLIGNENAFADGIMNLLSLQNNLVINKEFYRDEASTLRDVVLQQPDVVVLISNRSMNIEDIVDMLMSTYRAAQLRLVIISLETVEIKIFEREGMVGGIKSTNILPAGLDDFLLIMNKNWKALSCTSAL